MRNQIATGFDFLAPIYDGLARLVIGGDIVNSQLHFLKHFSGCSCLLILGGGSGWLLEYLCKNNSELEIHYIDISSRMIEAAKNKIGDRKHIHFILGTEDDIPNHQFDGVITNFYLDMFNQRSLSEVIKKIKRSLTNEAHWVVTDFINNRKTHAIKLWCMYRFFRIITQIEATQLADWQSEMVKNDCILLASKTFKNGFITSNLYQIATP